jgi:hypothetical protein
MGIKALQNPCVVPPKRFLPLDKGLVPLPERDREEGRREVLGDKRKENWRFK